MSEKSVAEKIQSFPEQLKRSFVPGTAERAKIKKIAEPHTTYKWSAVGLVIGLIIWLVWYVFPTYQLVREVSRTESQKEVAVQEQRPSRPQAVEVPRKSNAVKHLAHWGQSQNDGTTPQDTWSQEVAIPVGCSVAFPTGEGIHIRYRFYTKVWMDYQSGTSPNMSHFQMMVSKPGMTGIGYTLTCP